MASKNSYQQSGYYSTIPNNRVELTLDDIDTCLDCGSRDLIETSEGFACRECGCILESRALEYHVPYGDKSVHHAIAGTTQIGLKSERYRNAHSVELQALQKLHSIKNYEEQVMQSARVEISRILGCLNFPTSTIDFTYKNFKETWAKLQKRTKYRSVDKLVPIVIGATLKLQNISVNEQELLSLSNISKKEFTAFKLQLRQFIPQYAGRNRMDYMLQKVLEVSESFELGTKFYYLAKKILLQFWDAISQTKDDVIAGVVASIAVMCLDEYDVSVNAVCKRLGIQMSAIQYQVKKNFFDRFKLRGFKSLIGSSRLLKMLLGKLNIVESDEVQKRADVVEVKMGSAGPTRSIGQKIALVAFTDDDKKRVLALYYESRKQTILRRIIGNKSTFRHEVKLFGVKIKKNESGTRPPCSS